MARTITREYIYHNFIICMHGSINLLHYCPKCISIELFNSDCCAFCGHEDLNENFPSTKFDCTPSEKDFLLAKANYINKNVNRCGLSAYNPEDQKKLNVEFNQKYAADYGIDLP